MKHFSNLDKLLQAKRSLKKITFLKISWWKVSFLMTTPFVFCLHIVCANIGMARSSDLSHICFQILITPSIKRAGNALFSLLCVQDWSFPWTPRDTPPTCAHSLNPGRIHTAGSVWSDSRVFGFTHVFSMKRQRFDDTELGIQPAGFTVSESAVKAVQC